MFGILLFVIIPALGEDRVFQSVRRDENGTDLRLGKVADDVKGLEVAAEFLS